MGNPLVRFDGGSLANRRRPLGQVLPYDLSSRPHFLFRCLSARPFVSPLGRARETKASVSHRAKSARFHEMSLMSRTARSML